MRNNIIIGTFLLALISFSGCEKEETRAILNDDISPNELQNLTKSEYVLALENASLTFETFKWSAPDYGFQASISYILQASPAESDFSSPIEVLSTDTLAGSVTVGNFNKMMLDAGLDPETPYDMEFRVVSLIGSNVDSVFSTVRTAKVTAYATVFPPIYMIGGAVGGWDPSLAVTMYTTGTPKEYSIICEWTSGEAFRFFSSPGWDATDQWNWTYFEGGSVASELENANDGDVNLRFTGASGFYKITANLQDKVITMEAVSQPRMLMVGAAVPGGWDIDNPTEMTFLSDGVFEATAAFTNDAFRFFTANDWGTGLNYPYFKDLGFEIDAVFEDALDGDNNFKFIGTPGTFKCTLNMWEKIITMEAQ